MMNGSGTVSKALSLLDEFLDGSRTITLSQFSERTGIHKTTVLRLCQSLIEAGFLDRDGRGAYRLGGKIWHFAQLYRRNFRLEDVVRPLLREVQQKTGESVSYYIREGDERVCLYRENARHTIRHHVEEGARMPLASGVVGRVLQVYSEGIGSDAEKIRARGFFIAQGREPHTRSAAVPVHDAAGTLRGALVVSGPSVRFAEADALAATTLLKEAAVAIQDALPMGEPEEAAAERGIKAAGYAAKMPARTRPAPVKKLTQRRRRVAKGVASRA